MVARRKVQPGRCLGDAVGLLLLALVLGLVSKWLHPRAPAWSIAAGSAVDERMTLAEVGELFGENVLWLDVRSAESFAAGHIPGALRMATGDSGAWLYENFDMLLVETRPVVVYGGPPDEKAALRAAGYLRANTRLDPVVVLEGGWSSWLEAGRPVQHRQG